MLDVALLGCGGSLPISERYLSATLIQYQGRKCLIDCGEGTQVSMRLLGWGFKTIDVICLTHFHGDHLYGLPGLLLTIGNSGRTDSLAILGPIGLSDLFDDLKVWLPELPYELIFYENTCYEFNNIKINTIELDHSAPCLGYNFEVKRRPRFDLNKAVENHVPKRLWNKLQKGNSITYEGKVYQPEMVLGQERKGLKVSVITDTRPIDTIPPFIKHSDLLICEGSYGNNADIEKAISNKHMTFEEAAKLAKEGQVHELILTHFSPVLREPDLYIENATNHFSNSIVGYDRLIRQLLFNKVKH